MSLLRRVPQLGWMLGLVPAVYALAMLAPEGPTLQLGVGEALGCGGTSTAPAPPGWTWLKPSMLSFTERTVAPVATDGFFVIDAVGNELSVEAAQDAMSVVVTDAAGEPVPGKVTLLKEKPAGLYQRSYLFGWSADEPLEIGAHLTATLSASSPAAGDASNVGGEFPLQVVEAPATIGEPSLAFPAWFDFYEGTGPALSCPRDFTRGSCDGPAKIEVAEGVIEQAAVGTQWQPPALKSGVAWEAHLEPSPTHSDALVPVVSLDYLASEAEPNLDLGSVIFPTSAAEYCVTLVVKDLRTQLQTRAEHCAKPKTPEGAFTHTELASCASPPSAALTEAWCRLRGPTALAACSTIQAGGAGNAGGSAATPMPAPGDTANKAHDSSGTSKGCQLGGASGSPAGAALLLGLAALVVLRRRSAVAS